MSGTEELFDDPLHPYTKRSCLLFQSLKPVKRAKGLYLKEMCQPCAYTCGMSVSYKVPKRFEPCDKEVPVYKK